MSITLFKMLASNFLSYLKTFLSSPKVMLPRKSICRTQHKTPIDNYCAALNMSMVGSTPSFHSSRPLRVRHIIDAGPGRMVISGRMADVCAELERLAACETAM